MFLHLFKAKKFGVFYFVVSTDWAGSGQAEDRFFFALCRKCKGSFVCFLMFSLLMACSRAWAENSKGFSSVLCNERMPLGLKPCCAVCKTNSSSMWKKGNQGEILCNNCTAKSTITGAAGLTVSTNTQQSNGGGKQVCFHTALLFH